MIAVTVSGFLFAKYLSDKVARYGEGILLSFVTLCNALLTYSVFRLVQIASVPFKPIINPVYFQILVPLSFGFVISYLVAPKIISLMVERGVVTDPQAHAHPGMILKKPSARGGSLIFTLGVILASLLFVKIKPVTIGIFASMILATVLGILDDIQNTKPLSKLSWLENPPLRLLLQIIVVLPIILAGVQVNHINNPINIQNPLQLNFWQFDVGSVTIAPIAIIFTIVWIVWIMNLLSWSNGVDGQYSGVIGIAGLMIALITHRLLPFDYSQKDMMEIAAIASGASLGLLPFNWFPSKIMWGFGAISAGVVLAGLSVVSQAKIATSFIVLLVPFLDGAMTVTRRLMNKQSPFKGDRGHLHHLLLERGWSRQRVAMFYWIATALTGIAGYYAADRSPILTAMTLAGLVAFFIIALNIRSAK